MWIYRYEVRSWHKAQELDNNDEITEVAIGSVKANWYHRAICSGMDEELFFGTETFNDAPPISLKQLRLVRDICDQCPVIRECLTHALTVPEQYGIWAGTSGNAREKMLKDIKTGIRSLTQVVSEYLEDF